MLRSRTGPSAPRIHPRWSPRHPTSILLQDKPRTQTRTLSRTWRSCSRFRRLVLAAGVVVLLFVLYIFRAPGSRYLASRLSATPNAPNALVVKKSSQVPLFSPPDTIQLHRVQTQLPDGQRANKPASPEKLRWPPTVTALPETHSTAAARSNMKAHTTTTAVDAQFCRAAPCRLLVPLSIIEREPKAQEHLIQLLTLASALNRTLVLPNAARGKLGACLRWDFAVYLDIASVVRVHRASVMMMDDFRTWTDVRPQAPSAHVVAIGERADARSGALGYSSGDNVFVQLDGAEGLLDRARCLRSKFRHLDLDEYAPLSLHLVPPAAQSAMDSSVGALLVDALTRDDVRHASWQGTPDEDFRVSSDHADQILQQPSTPPPEPDVLLVHWDLHRLPFPVSSALDYAPSLWTLAARLTAPLGPYLAVHWNMAKTPPDVLPACADALVDTLDTLLHDESLARGIAAVWLAADHPQGPGPHAAALQGVRDAFLPGGELARWRLTGSAEELASLRAGPGGAAALELGGGDDDGALGDSGVVDILEKMVAMRAALFVSSSKSCGRVSAATRQVVDHRTRTGGVSSRNVVAVFG